MKSIRALIATVLISASTACTPDKSDPQPNTYYVYFMGGQSNMEGYGYNRDLPESLRAPQPAVRIFHGKNAKDGEADGGVGLWAGLTPGHGTGFDTSGTKNRLSDRFGPELSFAQTMSAAAQGEKIAIIKYARGGTALVETGTGSGSWDPGHDGRNQYDHALAAIKKAMAPQDIDSDGVPDHLVPAGIIWMQGEADANKSEAIAANYAANLKRMMALLRAALGVNDLPIVIGRIQDSGATPETRIMAFPELVQAGQAAFVEADRCAAMTTVTRDFTFLQDRWHYRSDNYATLGTAFAEEMLALRDRCGSGATTPGH